MTYTNDFTAKARSRKCVHKGVLRVEGPTSIPVGSTDEIKAESLCYNANAASATRLFRAFTAHSPYEENPRITEV